ncbi:putative zinc metalloprotease [Teratosphaeria nubilosa]|uniref:Peptide hydrolase n=1 Tax=Teratosphaeria nubilosa TaxID=161662 RepID=A0A6G1LKV2_9PEZI|nr:putative zinc metalloprotease [Teratosphaeria nubilosa]
MAKKSRSFFSTAPVTVTTSLVYIALFVALLYTHLTVPNAPTNEAAAVGVNLTQAWLDLEVLSARYHPIDSRQNEWIRGWLVQRIREILTTNGLWNEEGRAEVFEDNVSNATFALSNAITGYGESNNVMVYIRGKRDVEGAWWEKGRKYEGPGGVLVNAHYDSVSSGFGATDDGVGVVTVLQLISHFTSDGMQPERGIVALLNNGEENGLYGAREFAKHPLSKMPHTFLNLEGAGAGGKAMLFRSTDAEVTRQYAKSPNPFGAVISGDGFKKGFVRSDTDYSVFTKVLGMRGLDVAFFAPRSRYHTDQDDARDTSRDSVWHMLSASLSTMRRLSSYSGKEFEGDSHNGTLQLKSGHTGVWFDLFGQAFAVINLHDLFALSITLLTAGPVLLILLHVIIAKSDKFYPFTRYRYLYSSDDDAPIAIGGLKGFFRFPIAFILSTAAVVGLALLQAKVNPYVVYSSEWVVWGMLLSAWFAVAWFFLAGSDRVRPTALQRFFVLFWMYILTWALLVAATIGENNLGLGSPYFVVIYNAAVWLALLVSYLEFLALPKKQKYIEHVADAAVDVDGRSTRPSSRGSRALLAQSHDRASNLGDDAEEEATERTSLLRGRDARTSRSTFTRPGKRRHQEEDDVLDDIEDPFLTKAYGDEQLWSSKLPQWTWILQFLIVAPINIIVVGQLALLATHSLHQTPADGNAVLPIYLLLAAFAVLIMLPLAPFLHRFPFQVPSLLLLVFVGCLIYNLLIFPFSREARLKTFFVQQIDLDTGINHVALTGIDGFIQNIIAQIPSAAGKALSCGAIAWAARPGLTSCSWAGLTPQAVTSDYHSQQKSHKNNTSFPSLKHWLNYTTNLTSPTSAIFTLRGANTKACRILFDNPVASIHINDSSSLDTRMDPIPEIGTSQLRLFSRTWDKSFEVHVNWTEGLQAKGQKGQVQCLWSEVGEVPAFEEVRAFQPVWAAVTKHGDGLVEGVRAWEL